MNIRGKNLPCQIGFFNGHAFNTRVHDFLEQGPGKFTAFSNNDLFAFRIFDVFRRFLTGQRFINPKINFFAFKCDLLNTVKIIQDKFRRIAHGFQQNCDRHFPAAVDPHVEQILGIKLQVQPGPPNGDHARRINQFAGSDGFPFVMIKKDSRRPVQLTDDYAF